MEKNRLDNGMIIIALISNILGPLGIMVYFFISYLEDETKKDELIVLIPLSLFMVISLLVFIRFRKVEFDDQFVYVKNIFNSEVDTFPIRNIKSVKKIMFGFRGTRRNRSGKNYTITYTDHNGNEKKVKFMATIRGEAVSRFKKLTSFLGPNGFLSDN